MSASSLSDELWRSGSAVAADDSENDSDISKVDDDDWTTTAAATIVKTTAIATKVEPIHDGGSGSWCLRLAERRQRLQQWNRLNLLCWCASLSRPSASASRLHLTSCNHSKRSCVCVCVYVLGRAVSLRVGAKKWNIDNLNVVARKRSPAGNLGRNNSTAFSVNIIFIVTYFRKQRAQKKNKKKKIPQIVIKSRKWKSRKNRNVQLLASNNKGITKQIGV